MEELDRLLSGDGDVDGDACEAAHPFVLSAGAGGAQRDVRPWDATASSGISAATSDARSGATTKILAACLCTTLALASLTLRL